MRIASIDFSKIVVQKLAKIHNLQDFDCGDSDINEFLKNDALNYQENKIAITTLFLHSGELAGFFSSASDSIKLSDKEEEDHHIDGKLIPEFPAAKIARLGVDKRYQKLGFGTFILKWAIGYVLQCGELIGIRFITVDAYPNKVDWYKKLGFVQNLHKSYKEKEHVSMRLDLLNPSE